jgi:polysaccharide pyruvyl transferase WcaK-like protein
MNFEIVGVWPANKGAVLMLEAIRARLQQDFPQARFAVPMSWPAAERLALGLWATPARTKSRPGLATVFGRLPRRFRESLGFIPGDEVDVLLDASGFGYGDFWGLAKLDDRLTRRLLVWKRNGRKAILLPQALGPFTKPGMADSFRQALTHLDLAFVRDDASADLVAAVAPGRPNIRRSPDFTNLLHPELPRRLDVLRGRSIVIPNEKMVTGKPDAVRSQYLDFLKVAMDTLRESGRDPFILVHEGAKDRALAVELNARLAGPAELVDEPSALVTKAVISVAELSVSSRFHGLVSGLSAAVPSLACGWSHKYGELMSDYGCPDLLVNLDEPSQWKAKVELLLSNAADAVFRAALKDRGEEERKKSEAMWQEVLQVIRR